MVVETRYAAGDGVLLGAGDHWVLMTDPGDDDVLDEIWDVVSGARASDSSVTEQVLAIVDKAFAGEPPGLAIVDLAQGGSTSVSRGRGHVRVSGADRILSLDGGADPAAVPRLRRLAGGVVAASRATLSPLAHRVSPPRVHASPAPIAGGPLIDGIPDEILAATGPDGPPPRPRRRPTDEAGHDTGPLGDTTEPGPGFVERISEGAHTTIQPATADVASGLLDPHVDDADDDHDGSTVHRPELASHLRHGTSDTVLAVSCQTGHLTPADSKVCRVCRQPVAPQEPRRVPRPVLGGLRLPTGEVVPLDRGVVLGRKPAPLEGSTDWPHLVHLPSDHTFVSRMHLHIELDGWNVLARDLDSRGGTMLTMPGREPERMRAREAYVLEPGCSLDLAEVYEVRFEVGPVVPR
ncbi:FHA domain-containing protein [Nocardioides allogilvus]|uniref:FHA domain-containing protein n=1 Tax=Nocardioides allogilvus TaxID=2072017 RepID=UPI00055EDCBE|nr:FHA domain-containing protein [Nocardioides allogilvus]